MSFEPRKPRAIIVGAGAGGIATAARLAKSGVEVIVLEKNSFSGGRCSLIHHNDYRFDQGPSLLLLPKFFVKTFHDLGTTIDEEGIKLLKCDPNYRIYFRDRECVTLSTDQSLMKDEMEKWEGSSGYQKFLGFLQESHENYEFSVNEVLNRDFPSILSILRPRFFTDSLIAQVFQSMYSRVSCYFDTERLRRAFTFASMYMGMSPYDAPGLYSLLQYTELTEGIWYPKGGFHNILDAIIKISERYGAHYRLSTPVERVLVSSDGQRATGVKLSSGEQLEADIVVLNSDLIYSYNNLLPDNPPTLSDIFLSTLPKAWTHYISSFLTPTKTTLNARNASCSSISFYWGMDRVIPEFGVHNIFLADEYRQSFDDIFKSYTLPHDPSFYVNVPSRIDPTAAPEGKDAVIVLVPVGALLPDGPGSGEIQSLRLQELVERARDIVIDTIEKQFGFKDFRQWISFELINTPETWQEKFNLDRGAILGLSHDFLNVMYFRPPIRHPSLKSLFFVGASTHPGTGVPICLAGAKLTSEMILSDLGIIPPWSTRTASTSRQKHSRLDRAQSKNFLGTKPFSTNWWWNLVLQFTLFLVGIFSRVLMSFN